MARVQWFTQFTCHVYPQVEGAVAALLPIHRPSLPFGRYSFPIPVRAEGWADQGDWWRHQGGMRDEVG